MTIFRKTLAAIVALLAMQISIQVQASAHRMQNASVSNTQHGVIVESVDTDSEGEHLGIKAGDVIEGWTRATEHGAIDSPFDFTWVEIEQKPRGPLSLESHRGPQNLSWKFVTDQFGVKVRPVMREGLLNIYEEGAALARAGKISEAAETWKRTASAVSAEDPSWMASWLLSHAGWALLISPHPLEASEYFEEAIKRYPGSQPEIKGQLLSFWGTWNTEFGSPEKAEAIYSEALKLCGEKDEHTLTAAKYLEGIFQGAFQRSNFERAVELMGRSRKLREELAPNSSAVASSLMWLSSAYQRQGNMSSAQQLIEQAAEIDNKLAPNGPDMAQISTSLGNLAHYRGDQDQAEIYYLRSLTIAKKTYGGYAFNASPMLVNLGTVAQARGDDAAAERYWREALALTSREAPESGVAAAAHTNLSEVLLNDGRLDEAEQHLQRAMEIQTKRRVGGVRIAFILQNFGLLAYKRRDLKLAVNYLEQATVIFRQAGPTGTYLAGIRADLGSLFLETGELDKSLECFTEAASLHETLGPQSTEYGSDLAGLGSILLRQGKSAEATALYAKAIQVFEGQMSQLGGGSEARSIYRVTIADYYRDYVALLVDQGKPEAALDLLERSRARTLVELLETAHADIRQGVDAALLQQQRALRDDINTKADLRASLVTDKKDEDAIKAADAEIEKAIEQYQDVQARIRKANEDYAALTQPHPLTSQGIRKDLLDPDTVLLEYSLGDQRSYVFAVTTDSIKAFPIPTNAEIKTASVQLHKLLSAHPDSSSSKQSAKSIPTQQELMASARRLSEMVLKPVADQIAGKRIVVVADGALQYVPFSMLPDPAAGNASDHAFQPLVLNHEIVNLPSASVLAVLRRQAATRARPPKLVAVLADPVFGTDDPRVHSGTHNPDDQNASEAKLTEANRAAIFDADLLTRSAEELGLLSRAGALTLPRLPYTRQEAEAIKAAVPGTGALAALDFDASRATATSDQLSNYRIVHFATHALANSEHPELSGLVFSLVDRNGKSQDGFLRLNDIYNLNLPADLVVLSACETGLGKVIKGEGLIGLTRGFMYAGASRVVASLWSVSDVASAQLMASFYRGMEHDHLAPAAALRQAQISMWKQKRWNAPYFWAAFQIQGDWK